MANNRVRRCINDYQEWVHPFLSKEVLKYKNSVKVNTFYKVGIVPYKLAKENNLPKTLPWMINCECTLCGKKFIITWNNLHNRSKEKGIEICGNCTRKDQYNDEWRKKNSDAQKIAQNRPDVKARMSESLKNIYVKDPNKRNVMSAKLKEVYKGNTELRARLSLKSKEAWKNLEYQQKVTQNNGYYSGYYNSKFGRLFFNSSWEVFFIRYCEQNSEIVDCQRSEDWIPYKKPNGDTANYHPDFLVTWKNGQKLSVEIKGARHGFDIVNRKADAARLFYKARNIQYTILFKQDLKALGIELRNCKVREEMLRLKENCLVDCMRK